MNTAIIGPYFSSSGTTRHVRNLFRGLLTLTPDNVVLITFRETNQTLSGEMSSKDRVFVFDRIPLPENFDEFSDFIVEIVIKLKISVLHPQIKPFVLLCSTLAKHKLNAINHDIKIVGTWHSNFSWIQQAPYHLAMAIIGIQHCDGIIPVSDNVTSSVQQILDFPFPQISSVIPPGGIDFEDVNKPRQELLAKLKRRFAIEKKYIIFLGRLLYNKGIDTLIKSFKEISTDFRLIIIGKGPFKGELMKLIDKLELGSRIIFTDFISDDEVYALLQGSVIYCLPSRWESFSISTLEAMGAGCPVICSNVGGLGIWASEAAIMINPDNVEELTSQLIRVISDDSLLKELSEKSIKLAQLYDYKEIAKRTQNTIEFLIKNLSLNIAENARNVIEFDRITGEIRNLDTNTFEKFPEKMNITNFALYFPSEALENENKDVEPDLKYYKI